MSIEPEVDDTASEISSTATGSSSRPRSQFRNFFDTMPTAEKTELDRLLARAIYASGTPLGITENPEWVKFFRKLRPSYLLPSRYQISNGLLNDEYQSAKNNIKTKIDEALTVGMQCDGWSNIRLVVFSLS